MQSKRKMEASSSNRMKKMVISNNRKTKKSDLYLIC